MSHVLEQVPYGHGHCVVASRRDKFFLCPITARSQDDHAKAASQKEPEKQDRQLDEKWNCGWVEIVEHMTLLFELIYGWSRASYLEPVVGTQTGAAG